MSAETYDFAIIGAGSVGLIAADFAVKLGARVVLLERDRIGGDCTWSGCVPSKSLLKVAKVAHEIRTAARFGLHAQSPVVDMLQVRDYLRSTIDQIYKATTPEAMRQKGMDVILGPVSFIDSHTLQVGTSQIRAKKILIATGAQPVVPALPGLSEVAFSTYRDVFERDQLPKRMAVIGGGPVGIELAQAYQRLGAQVTIFAEQLLTKEEPDAVAIVQHVLQREGVHLVRARALNVAPSEAGVLVRSAEQEVACDLLLVAAGRQPTLDGLNLEAAGITYGADGIRVGDHLRTTAANVYAAGDVVGGEQFSHLAGWQGFQAARNALLPGNHAGLPEVMARVTFTDPELAQAGLTEAQARAAHGDDVAVLSWPINRVDRAVCDDDREGMIKIITRRDGEILGATIVAVRAGEAIMEIVMAIRHKIKVADLAGAIHAYPTYNSGIQFMATEMAFENATKGFSGTILRAASKLTSSF
ncbi:MAG: FAD-dependent oxidoreductase [Acidobacteriaceae bacterium]